MAKTKPSPGEWNVRPDYGQENVYHLWDKNFNYHSDNTPEVMDANARLMESAPALLHAVQLAYDFFINPGSFNPCDVERIYTAAINKAKGR